MNPEPVRADEGPPTTTSDGKSVQEGASYMWNSDFNGRKIDLEELQRIIKGLDGIEEKASSVFDTAGKFLGSTDKQLQDQMKELRHTVWEIRKWPAPLLACISIFSSRPSRVDCLTPM